MPASCERSLDVFFFFVHSGAFVSILRTLRSALLKAKLRSFRPNTVEQCVLKLQKSLLNHDIIMTGKIPKSTIVESKTIRGLKSLLDEDALVSLRCDELQNRIPKSLLSTPDVTSALVHVPSLLTQFRYLFTTLMPWNPFFYRSI